MSAPRSRPVGQGALGLGWALLALAALGGLGLELMHAFKVPAYLDADAETRRLCWRLAHAHAALLGLVQLVYGLSLRSLEGWAEDGLVRAAGRLLATGAVLLPLGFALGGVDARHGDPGLGILLVPFGAVATALGLVGLAARSLRG